MPNPDSLFTVTRKKRVFVGKDMDENVRVPALFEVARGNLEWLKKNYGRLKRQYDNKWVLIHDRRVIGSGDTFEEMLPQARQYEPSSVMLEYIHSKEVAMFF